MDRTALADLIVARLEQVRDEIRRDYRASEPAIGWFVVDDLLPADVARRIRACFPAPGAMKLKRSLREYKYVAAQMDAYDPLLEEAVYAFQDPRVVRLVGEVCGIEHLVPDEHLYAGGISMMGDRQFLNPHLDNSHDKDRALWRVLNLLYYVSEDWQLEHGGNLELWPDGPGGQPVTLHSRFNRLAVMATHEASWHSVSPIRSPNFRCCVSNYYFSREPLKSTDRFHVTSFRGRPEQPLRDVVLQADIALRSGIRKVFRKGLVKTSHLYRKDGDGAG